MQMWQSTASNMAMSMRRALPMRPREALQRLTWRRSHQIFGMCTSASISSPQQAQNAEQTQRTARSLRDVARGHVVHALLLPSSQDLVCKNMMCEHVGSSCACKLSLVLERLPQLQTMDLSNNQLRFLPASTFELTQLTHLDLARNQLTELSVSVTQLQQLQVLDLSHNCINKLPEDALLALPSLREIRITGNPMELESVVSAELRAKIVVTDA